MRKTTVINQEPKQSVLPIIGGVLIAFAVADFALSYAGVNLTSFLGLHKHNQNYNSTDKRY